MHNESKLTRSIVAVALCYLFVIGLAATPSLARASGPTPIYECHECTAYGMQSVARSVVAKKISSPQPGDGDYVTVYNLAGNKILTFWVGWYKAAAPRPGYMWYVTALKTPNNVARAFSNLHNIYIQNGRSLILTLDLEGVSAADASSWPASLSSLTSLSGRDSCYEQWEGLDNAYDAAVSSAVRNKVRDDLRQYLEDRSIYGEHFWGVAQVVRLVVSPFLGSYEVPLVFDQRFPDGGSIGFRYDWQTDRLVHITGTIEDCEGNTVSANRAALVGRQFRFNNDYNLREFEEHVTGIGASLILNGGGAPMRCSGGQRSDGTVYVHCQTY